MCAAASELGSIVSTVSQADLAQTVSDFTSNYVDKAGQVLTDPMKQKYQQASDALGTLQSLGSDVGKDYAYYKARASATTTTTTTTTTGNQTTYTNPPYTNN